MNEFNISVATVSDEIVLAGIFLDHITSHPEYISHGEMQMGVGTGRLENGKMVAEVSPFARNIWLKYIHGNIECPDSVVYKAVTSDGNTAGFCVATITEDGTEPFGMLCDLLVSRECRQKGIGTALFNKALEWFGSRGVADVYLESGLNNHAAHEYFMRRGFCKVSEIYKLMK